MGGINLNESGLDFVRQVFVTFGGNTTVLTLFLLSVLLSRGYTKNKFRKDK